MVNKMIAGAILMAVFMGLAQEMRISESETRHELCVLEVDRAEQQCRQTGDYPHAASGPVDVIDHCETYALQDKNRCAELHIAR